MLELTYKSSLDKLVRSPNIAAQMGDEDVKKLGLHCLEGFNQDDATRAEWKSWYAEAIKMAMQIKEAKTFPWPNCSNIKFPLITIACLYFHAKAYPAIVNSQDVVKCRPIAKNNTPEYLARCDRVGAHMSYQLMEETNWESSTDKALLILPLLGCVFKKTYYNASRKQKVSELISPEFFVVDYNTTDLETCRRTSELFTLHKNDIISRHLSGRWLDITTIPPTRKQDQISAVKDQASKMVEVASPESGYYPLIEQQLWLDLDKDGYEEPYVATFRQDTGQIARLVARWYPKDITRDDKNRVISIKPYNCYTKIPFIPSPDGAFYELGFGRLLGPLNASIDTIVNQLVDAGTMSILGGGFLGRGAKIKGGEATFKPYEWKRVDSSGDDLRKNLVELNVREPSRVLLELLTFLVSYGQQVAGATDPQVGENPGQNTPAEVMRIMNENGRQIYAATFKRIWRALKDEFKAFYLLNYHYPEDLFYQDKGTNKWFQLTPDDYAYPEAGIVPAADPNMVSSADKQRQATMAYEVAKGTPGADITAAGRLLLQAFNHQQVDVVFPPKILPDGTSNPNAPQPPPDPKMEKIALDAQKEENRRLEAAQRLELDTVELFANLDEVRARLTESQARVILLLEEAKTIQDDSKIAMMNTQIGLAKLEQDGYHKSINLITSILKLKQQEKKATEKKEGASA